MCSSLFRGSAEDEKDSKVLSYGDVVLYTSDLYTLNPGTWLNDNIISFACEYMLSKAAPEVREQVAIVSAASCELIRYSGDMEIVRDIFFSLGFFKGKAIKTIVGGNHWSLLVFDRRSARFEYYDSMRPAKDAVARQLVNTIKPVLGAPEVSFEIVECPQQRNSFDCGMYVIEFVRHQLKLSEESYSLGISSSYIESERQHWQDVIVSLSKTQYIVQNDKWLTFIIRAPYAKIADTEIEYGDDIFMFSAPPYYLRVHLPREVVDDNTGTAKYDSTLGELDFCESKTFAVWMICTWTFEQKKISAQRLVEEIRDSDDDEEENLFKMKLKAANILWSKKVTDIQAQCSENSTDVFGYGFAWRRKGILGIFFFNQSEMFLLTRLDMLDPEDALQRALKLDFGLKLEVDADDRQRLKDFPRKRLPTCNVSSRNVLFFINREKLLFRLSMEEQRTVLLSLVDIVFAFAYDSRINEWETCCETGWNITKLAPSLAFLCQWRNAKEAFVGSVRRSLCYPLYRNWDLSLKVVSDTKLIIRKGRAALLHVLSKMHGILIGSGEFRYLFNDLFITDYCLWIQSVEEAMLKWLQKAVDEVEVCFRAFYLM
ncbi:Ulp1 protease family, catalytic domain protein [Ostertagia ostertagi]